MNFTSATAQGKRDYQEDSFICAPPFFAVADGMGGHGNGGVASRELLAGMVERLPEVSFLDDFQRGHARLRATVEANLNPQMGTTLTAIWLIDRRVTWLQAGDSRLYHIHAGKVRQVTTDECLAYPYDNVLRRCVRAMEDPPLLWGYENMGKFFVEEGDQLILCSDGVSFYLDPEPARSDIGFQMWGDAPELVAKAIEMGGHDNATAIVIRV